MNCNYFLRNTVSAWNLDLISGGIETLFVRPCGFSDCESWNLDLISGGIETFKTRNQNCLFCLHAWNLDLISGGIETQGDHTV